MSMLGGHASTFIAGLCIRKNHNKNGDPSLQLGLKPVQKLGLDSCLLLFFDMGLAWTQVGGSCSLQIYNMGLDFVFFFP